MSCLIDIFVPHLFDISAMQHAKIFSGTGSQQLAEQICKQFGAHLGKVNIQRFYSAKHLCSLRQHYGAATHD